MATDGNLLQGEITDFSQSRLQEREVVEGLLAGMLRALVEEQLDDRRFEAQPSIRIPDPSIDEKPLIDHPSPKTMIPVGAEAKTTQKRSFICIPGGREGNA